MENKIIPSLYIQSKGEESIKLSLSLAKAKTRTIVRFTGGCGLMSAEDAESLYDIFTLAFCGFDGAILFGGTRMVKRTEASIVVSSITEIPPLIRDQNKDCVILGVVPKTSDLNLSVDYGLIVSNEENNDYVTIAHPNQDICLVVQQSVDKGVIWETEFEECIKITKNFRDYVGWDSVLVSYNGGSVTEKEILKTAELGWPILLVNDSGRITQKYANDKKFLKNFPNVVVSQNTSWSIRERLFELKALNRNNLKSSLKKGGEEKVVFVPFGK